MKKTSMLEQLSPAARGLILDMDGVLWRDSAPIGDLARVFGRMQTAGLKVMLATNNATKTVDQYLKKLAGFGVALEAWQIITSSHGVGAALLKEFPDKGRLFVLGETGVISALGEAGFTVVTDPLDQTPVVAVVAGLDHQLSYEKLSRAMVSIRAGASFYGTNPDVTFPSSTGLVPGAGAILAAIQACTGVAPIVIGKPSPYMFALCAERMGLAMGDIVVVGDRLETDIAGGQAVGARTALVLSGVSTAEQAADWKPQPDLVAADLAALVGA